MTGLTEVHHRVFRSLVSKTASGKPAEAMHGDTTFAYNMILRANVKDLMDVLNDVGYNPTLIAQRNGKLFTQLPQFFQNLVNGTIAYQDYRKELWTSMGDTEFNERVVKMLGAKYKWKHLYHHRTPYSQLNIDDKLLAVVQLYVVSVATRYQKMYDGRNDNKKGKGLMKDTSQKEFRERGLYFWKGEFTCIDKKGRGRNGYLWRPDPDTEWQEIEDPNVFRASSDDTQTSLKRTLINLFQPINNGGRKVKADNDAEFKGIKDLNLVNDEGVEADETSTKKRKAVALSQTGDGNNDDADMEGDDADANAKESRGKSEDTVTTAETTMSPTSTKKSKASKGSEVAIDKRFLKQARVVVANEDQKDLGVKIVARVLSGVEKGEYEGDLQKLCQGITNTDETPKQGNNEDEGNE